jgi:hypothetical protein
MTRRKHECFQSSRGRTTNSVPSVSPIIHFLTSDFCSSGETEFELNFILLLQELNRVRRAAIAFGFIELLDGLAAIFERECTLLPGGAHPDCALQLTHAAGVLHKPYSRDIKYNITPLRTKFINDD